MGLVQKIIEHLAAIDHGKASVAELHVPRIVPRRAQAVAERARERLGLEAGSDSSGKAISLCRSVPAAVWLSPRSHIVTKFAIAR
jgi:hypothetical protein